jgi:IMP dehydrogenase/GMP reductase
MSATSINGWDGLSHSLHELILLPGKIPDGVASADVDISAPLTAYERGDKSEFSLGIPIMSAAMQAVTGPIMAVELGKIGGTGVLYCSQPIENEAQMVRDVDGYKVKNEADFVVSAAINTHDYEKRVPKLIDAGVDVLYIDTSQAFNNYARDCLKFVKKFSETPVIGGNIATTEGFDFLVEHGADGIKVGMGTGSICTTQEQIGVGRGQASAVYEVAKARDEWYGDTDLYIPIISDGGSWISRHITVALALGADSVMVGKYLAGTKESNSDIETDSSTNEKFKYYWGEGSEKAKAWSGKRYGHTSFEEGIEIKVPYVGPLEKYMAPRLMKIKDGIRKAGFSSIGNMYKEGAELELISPYLLLENMYKALIVES